MDEQLLKDYTDTEKGAYLEAIASIASADREATGEEIQFLEALADEAAVSGEQRASIIHAAKDPGNVSLQKSLDNLKGSELKYSIVTDIISFAKSDGKFSNEEHTKIQEIAQYLGINAEQVATLSTFVDKAEEAAKNGENISHANFLSSQGFGNIFQNSGIPTGGILKGLLGSLAPLLIARMMHGSRGNMTNSNAGLGSVLGNIVGGSHIGGNGSGGGIGGMLGGLLGGNNTNNRSQQGGGLGSIISVLSGGRGYGGMGNILGSLFSGNNR